MKDHARSKSNGIIVNSEITRNILSRIPIEFVSRSRAVCKFWRNHLKKPKTGFLFTGQNLQLCYGEEDEVNVEQLSLKSLTKINHCLGQECIPNVYGSCNGLVCFPKMNHGNVICNPMTGEYVDLPKMDIGGISMCVVYTGFGYCQSTNEYKVVEVYYDLSIGFVRGKVQVYTLGDGNGWRYKGEVPHIVKDNAVFANSSLYWFDKSKNSQFNNIIAFDLADETFSVIPLTLFRGYKYPPKSVDLVSLRGSLGVYNVSAAERSNAGMEEHSLDMWILKKKEQVSRKKKKKEQKIKMSNQKSRGPCGYSPVDEIDDTNLWVWIREFSINYGRCIGDPVAYEPFSITPSHKILLWQTLGLKKRLFCYDPKTLTSKELWDEYMCLAEAIPHMNTFVSLEDLGEKSARYIPDDSKSMHKSSKA